MKTVTEQSKVTLMSYTLYVLECSNDSLYTGYTTDLKRRYKEHCEGSKKCKYTQSFPPKKIAAHWTLPVDLSSILKIEYAFKRLNKSQKLHFIHQPDELLPWATALLF